LNKNGSDRPTNARSISKSQLRFRFQSNQTPQNARKAALKRRGRVLGAIFGGKSSRREKSQTMEVMQVSRTYVLAGGRGHHTIGRIKASSGWRAANAPGVDADRLTALRALIREAEEYEADAIVGLDFEVDSVNCADIGGAPLQRVAATGIAVKFDEAA
jgi:uncharacterized protein YbjQ (UPF0145 family)